jgi:hypothetical protein
VALTVLVATPYLPRPHLPSLDVADLNDPEIVQKKKMRKLGGKLRDKSETCSRFLYNGGPFPVFISIHVSEPLSASARLDILTDPLLLAVTSKV